VAFVSHPEGVGCGALGEMPEAELEYQKRYPYTEHRSDIRNQKRPASARIELIRKTPKITQTNGRTDGSENKSASSAPVLPLFFKHFHKKSLIKKHPAVINHNTTTPLGIIVNYKRLIVN
jgi:hypothetical protein